MPRRIQIKPARIAMPARSAASAAGWRSVAGGKTIGKKGKTSLFGTKGRRSDMRFSISLVILIGMLTFSMLLLLISLNRFYMARAGTKIKTNTAASLSKPIVQAKPGTRILDDSSLDFKITVPVQLGTWLYKIGEVKSPVDDTLSNQYLRIYVQLSGAKSNNFDQQNKEILTIRKFSADEWKAIEKACQKGKEDVCSAGGTFLANETDPESGDLNNVYAFSKPTDCPQSLEAKCSLADKIIQSFQLK